MQATLMLKWYSKVNKQKVDDLYLAAFLQETGKILIASDVIQEDEDMAFKSDVAMSNNLAQLEKSYVDVSSAEVTAEVFSHWGFEKEFIEMIKYADNPAAAPDEIVEYSTALHIVKTVLPLNKPFSDQAINFGLRKARDAGYEYEILEDVIDEMLDMIEDTNE
jgi:HD-like signal output (HDOD) protein